MGSTHVPKYWSHWIRSEPKFKDDTILPHSRGPRSPDTFWTEVQGWCNPTTFMKTEVTGSILDRCPRMIQSLFILEDRGHWITFGQMSRDDTIPIHSQRPRSLDHFRENAQEWYNPTTFSRTKVTRYILDRCHKMIQSLIIIEDRGHRITLRQMPMDDCRGG